MFINVHYLQQSYNKIPPVSNSDRRLVLWACLVRQLDAHFLFTITNRGMDRASAALSEGFVPREPNSDLAMWYGHAIRVQDGGHAVNHLNLPYTDEQFKGFKSLLFQLPSYITHSLKTQKYFTRPITYQQCQT